MKRELPSRAASARRAARQYSALLREEARLSAFGEKIRLVLSVIAVKRLEAEAKLEALRSTTKPVGHGEDTS